LLASPDDTDAPSRVASGRLAVGSALMLPHLFAAERLSSSARERVRVVARSEHQITLIDDYNQFMLIILINFI
jgi:hypothetical protein